MNQRQKQVYSLVLGAVLFFTGCSLDSAKRRYVLADRFFVEKKYEAAVSEFEKISLMDGQGELGTTSLFRAALIQTTNLAKHQKAVDNLKEYLLRDPNGPYHREAKQLLSDILFEKMDRYSEAKEIFSQLISETVVDEKKAEYEYKRARCEFLSQHFEKAAEAFLLIHQQYSKINWGERALFDYGLSILTLGQSGGLTGSRDKKKIERSLEIFSEYLKAYPAGKLKAEVLFESAAAYEELEDWDKAFKIYDEIQNTYPSPNVVKIKQSRLKERRSQKETVRQGRHT